MENKIRRPVVKHKIFVLISITAILIAYSNDIDSQVFEKSNVQQKSVINRATHEYYMIEQTQPIQPQSKPKIINPPKTFSENNSAVRWVKTEPLAIGISVSENAFGTLLAASWWLTDDSISFYDNSDSVALWSYPVAHSIYYNWTAISDSGNIIAGSNYKNFYLFRKESAVPFFNFDVTTIDTSLRAARIVLTSDGRFLVATTICRNGVIDSCNVFGFSSDNQTPVWQFKVFDYPDLAADIQGVRLSGNDSIFIINTTHIFHVVKTYTGEIIFSGNVGPTQTANTQEPMGINYDGSRIVTTNHEGYFTVYQRIGNTYNQILASRITFPPYNNRWISSVDMTYDGNYFACGTLDDYWPLYDGAVFMYSVANGTEPLWSYPHMGDMVQCVSFSKSGNILSACSWGDGLDTTNNLVIFKTSLNTPVPIFRLISPGSLYYCSTSKNGTSVSVIGEAMWARNWGRGGTLYNISVDTNDSPIGIPPVTTNLPKSFSLSQNFPNPFNPSTVISFEVPKSSLVTVTVYDLLGREIEKLLLQHLNPGKYHVNWDASNYPSGLYFYTLRSGEFTETKKMVLVK